MRKTIDFEARKAEQARFARLVKVYAQLQDVTMTDLADELGISRVGLHQKFSGDGPIELAEIRKIAARLGVPATALLADPDDLLPDDAVPASRWMAVPAGQQQFALAA